MQSQKENRIDYRLEAAKMKWTTSEFAALLSNINPKQLIHNRNTRYATYTLPHDSTEKTTYQKNLSIIEGWVAIGENVPGNPYWLINKALAANLDIPEGLLSAVCSKAVNEKISEKHYPILHQKMIERYPISTEIENNSNEDYELDIQNETTKERDERYQKRAEQIYRDNNSQILQKTIAKQISDEETRKGRKPPSIDRIIKVIRTQHLNT